MRLLINLLICIMVIGMPYGALHANNSCANSMCSLSAASCKLESVCSTTCGSRTFGKPEFLPRSQGEDRVRDYLGQTLFQNLTDEDDYNWVLSLAVSYDQNFKNKELGAYFFPNGTNTLTVGPDASQPDSSGVDVRNVDLGLSPTFKGSLTIAPEIKNFLYEPSLYVGLDRWLSGLFIWTKLPIVHTRWELECCETDTMIGGDYFLPDQMADGATPIPVPVGAHTIIDAFSGKTTFGEMQTGLCAARMPCCEGSKTAIADIPVHLGWNFFLKDTWYLGLYARTVFPTGSTEHRHSIFNPRVGYDRWQLGGGLQASWRFYETVDVKTKEDVLSLGIYLDGYVTHIFSKEQCRVFDLLANGSFSRYLLIKEFSDDGQTLTGNMFNVVDKFTAKAESRFNWNAEGLIFFEAVYKNWIFDAGYNVWARDREHIECECIKLCNMCTKECEDSCITRPTTNFYGIKGGIDYESVGTDANQPNTASTSTISKAGSVDPINQFIDANDLLHTLNIRGAEIPFAMSHKVFGSIGYAWTNRNYPLYFTLGSEVEFGNNNNALTRWSLFGKAGVAYN